MRQVLCRVRRKAGIISLTVRRLRRLITSPYSAQAPRPQGPVQTRASIRRRDRYSAPPPRPQYGSPYPPQYPQQGRISAGAVSQQPQAPAYQYAQTQVTIPQGTLLQLRTSEPVDSKRAMDGSPVQFTVIQDVTMGGVLAIPRGATVHGVVTETKKSGDLGGRAELALDSDFA